MVEEFGFEIWRGAGDFCQGDVDGVGGGAGHQAEDEERAWGIGLTQEDFTTERAELTEKKSGDAENG